MQPDIGQAWTGPRTSDHTLPTQPRSTRPATGHNPYVAININSYRELFTNIRLRPRMWLIRDDFATVVAFIDGCNEANARTLLTGLREWLVTRADGGDNWVWWGLVAHLTEPVGAKNISAIEADLDARLVANLFDMLDEFLELRAERDGLRRIFAAYEDWHRIRHEHAGLTADPGPATEWPRAASRLTSQRTLDQQA